MTIRDNHGIHPMQFMEAGAVYAALLEETSELDLPAEFTDIPATATNEAFCGTDPDGGASMVTRLRQLADQAERGEIVGINLTVMPKTGESYQNTRVTVSSMAEAMMVKTLIEVAVTNANRFTDELRAEDEEATDTAA